MGNSSIHTSFKNLTHLIIKVQKGWGDLNLYTHRLGFALHNYAKCVILKSHSDTLLSASDLRCRYSDTRATPYQTPPPSGKYYVWIMGIFHLSPAYVQAWCCTVSRLVKLQGYELRSVYMCIPLNEKVVFPSTWTAAKLFTLTVCQDLRDHHVQSNLQVKSWVELLYSASSWFLLCVYCPVVCLLSCSDQIIYLKRSSSLSLLYPFVRWTHRLELTLERAWRHF